MERLLRRKIQCRNEFFCSTYQCSTLYSNCFRTSQWPREMLPIFYCKTRLTAAEKGSPSGVEIKRIDKEFRFVFFDSIKMTLLLKFIHASRKFSMQCFHHNWFSHAWMYCKYCREIFIFGFVCFIEWNQLFIY